MANELKTTLTSALIHQLFLRACSPYRLIKIKETARFIKIGQAGIIKKARDFSPALDVFTTE